MRKTLPISIFILLVVLCGCKKHTQKPINYFNSNDSLLILKNWHVVGPFLFAEQGNNLKIDNLNIFGYDENTISIKKFLNIDSKKVKSLKNLSSDFRSVTGANDKPVMAVNLVFGSKDVINANAYMGCIIRSDKEENLRLNFSSDNGAKVWLNNKPVLNYDKDVSVFAYEHYIPVTLRKGDNFLLVKVYNSSGDWLMYSRIEKESNFGYKRHQNIVALLNNRNFLKRSIIDSLDYLEANSSLPYNKYSLSIYDRNKNEILSDSVDIQENWKKDISFLQDGLYQARLVFNNDTLEQLFYKGNAVVKTEELLKRKKNNLSLNDNNDLNAHIFRFNHLMKPENKGSNFTEKQSWQKKMIYLYRDISSIIKDNPKHTLIDVPGLHIRTYVSEIDNQPQYYIAHVPENFRADKSYPLVFLIPFKVTYNYHYLASMRVADLQLIENMQQVADENNIIVIEPFFREVGIPTFNGIEETDFFEVLKAVGKDYIINRDQIYFVGSCEAAHKALKLAVKYPDVPAALGFISPSYTESYGYSSRNEWVAQGEPLQYLKNLRNVPITVIHSKLDGHVPISVSEQFAETYSNSGLSNLEFIQLDDVIDQYYWSQYSDDLIKSLLKHKKVNNPPKISLYASQLKGGKAYWLKILQFSSTGKGTVDAEINENNEVIINSDNVASFSLQLDKLPFNKNKNLTVIENNKVLFTGKPVVNELSFGKITGQQGIYKTEQTEGPFCDAFLNKFIIVIGKSGLPEENKKIKAMGDSLQTMWKYKYWNDCMAKYDTEITSSDISNSNLVLLGNAHSNLIIRKIIDKLPLVITKDGIELNKSKIKGDNLGFYMVYPNPLNKNKYVAIIGYNNPSDISLGPVDLNEDDYKDLYKSGWVRSELKHMEISCYGWFDYRIWNNSDNHVIKSGYFGPRWD